MAAGELLTEQDRKSVDEAIRRAEQLARFEFSVFVGSVQGDDPRAFATQLHNRLVAPARSILLMVDPTARVIEVVTGREVRRQLTDAEVQLAVLEMQTAFAAGELATGLKRGIAMLAEHARPQNTLHAGS